MNDVYLSELENTGNTSWKSEPSVQDRFHGDSSLTACL